VGKLKATLEYPDGFGTYDVEADDEAGLQAGIDEIDRQFETNKKAKANLADLSVSPEDRKRGLYAGKAPDATAETYSGGPLQAAKQAWERGVGRVAGNVAAVPSMFDRAIDDVVIPSDPMEGTSVRKGVPLFAGKRMLDAPQTSGGPAMLSGVADDIRHGLPEMPSGYAQALSKKSLGQKLTDPTWYQDMLAGNAPQMGVSLAGGALGGRGGAAVASGLMMSGDEFQRTQDYEEETGQRADNAGLKALFSGGMQGALDSIVPGSIAAGGLKKEVGALLKTALKEGGTEGLQKLISDAISPAETRSFSERMTDPKYLSDLAEEGVAGGILGGAMHPLGESGLRPTQPSAETGRLRPPTPADIIEGRARGMQPVDMNVPTGPRTEKAVSAATSPNKAARIVPAGTPIPDGMAGMTVDGGLLIYDRTKNASLAAVRQQVATPEGLAAFMAANSDTAVSTTDTVQEAPAAPAPVVQQTDAEIAELAKQIASRPAPAKALEPEDVAKKIERLVADPRTTPEEREILTAKYEQLTQVVRQRGLETAVAKEMGPQEEPLDAGLPPPEGDPYSDDFYLSEALRATEQSAGRTDRLGAPRPYGEQVSAVPEDLTPLEEPPVEIPPSAIAERQRLEAAAQAEREAPRTEPVVEPEPAMSPLPEPVASAPVAQEVIQPEPKKVPKTKLGNESNEEYKARILAAKEAKAAADAAKKPVSDRVIATIPPPKKAEDVAREKAEREAAATAQPMMDRVAETRAKKAPAPAPIADPKLAEQYTPKQLKAAEQLVMLAYHSERTAEDPSRKYAAEREVERAERDARAMGVDVDAISRSVGRETREVTPPQVTAETSPFMQARRAAEAAAAQEAKPEPKKKGAKKAAPVAGPDPLVARYQAAVDAERRLRLERNAQEDPDFKLDEYNEAVAELYESKKEADAKGVDVSATEPSFQLNDPKRLVRQQRYGEVRKAISRPEMDKALDEMKKRLPGIADLIDVIESQTELAPHIQEAAKGSLVDALTHKGRITLVAENMKSAQHVRDAVIHEAVGHLVPQQIFGKDGWRKKLDKWRADSTYFRDFVQKFGETPEGRMYRPDELAEEAVSFHAAKLRSDPNYKPPTAFRMLIAKVREWLRETFGGRVAEFSDADLAAFLARSEEKARVGFKPGEDGDVSFSKRPDSDEALDEDLFDAPDETRFDAFRRKIQDRMIRLRRLEEAAKKQGRTGTASTYDAEDAAHGKIGAEIEDLRNQFVDPILKMAEKGNVTLDEIGDWLYAVHAFDRNARGRKLDPKGEVSADPFSGMTDEEAAAKLKALEPKAEALNEIAEVVYAMLADERRRYVESGLATKEDVDGWVKAMGPTYVPLKHEEVDEVRGAGSGQGFSALRKSVQSAKGRSTAAENPLFHAIKQAETTVVRANKAEVGREFLKFIRENPNKDLWVEDPVLKKKTLAEDEEGNTLVKWAPDPLFMRDDIINVKENGKNIAVQIKDPLTLRAMKMAFTNENLPESLRGIATATRTYGSLLTMLSPDFWATNPIRDVQTAALNVGTGYGVKQAAQVGKNWVRSMRGVAKFLRDPNSQDEYAKLFAEMRKEGATVGWAPFEDAKTIERRIASDMKVLQRGPKDIRTWAHTALRFTKNVNEVMENATRLAVYKMAKDQGMSPRERRALTKNVTVNFNRKGELGPAFNALWMFGNVGIQGPVAMASFAKKNPKGAAKVATAMFALGAANAMANILLSDDDDDDGLSQYDELQESTKARNWILGRGMIPMAHGWNVFANAGRYAVETMTGRKKPAEAAVALAANAYDSFSPLGQSPTLGQALAPTVLDPIIQHEGNRTAFDSPIYPENLPFGAKKPDSQLKFRSAPEWAVKTAEGLNSLTGGDRVTPGGIDVSPETLQHGVDWATPGLVKFLWSTLVTLPGNVLGGKETRVKDVPIVRRFVNQEAPSADRGRFVKATEDLDTKLSQAKAYRGEGDNASEKNIEKYNALLSGPLRSRSDFETMKKLFKQLDDVPSTPEIEDLKLRVMRTAGKQYELSKRTSKYIPLDPGLIDNLTEQVDAIAPKAERQESTTRDIMEEMEGR